MPDDAFQNLKRRFKQENFIVGGPFAENYLLENAISFGIGSEDCLTLFEVNKIWTSQIAKMWDNVLREIAQQQFQIDLQERSNAKHAVATLSQLDRIAGPLCAEAAELYKTIPSEVWLDISRKIDRAGISLKNSLTPQGREVLRKLGHSRRTIQTWEEALVCDSDYGKKEIVDGKVKYVPTLSRLCKRRIYRAAENYREVLNQVYERRIHT